MSLYGTNYAEQVESLVPQIYDVYKKDLLHAGIRKSKAPARFSTMNDKIKKEIVAPMYELLQDYSIFDFQWYKKRRVPSRIANPVEKENLLKQQEDAVFFSRPKKSSGRILMEDVFLDSVYVNEKRRILKDIGFTRPVTTNVTPVEVTHNRLYELLKVKTLLTTGHLIKKRTLSYHRVLHDIQRNIFLLCIKCHLI
jgi:hypothetical protein